MSNIKNYTQFINENLNNNIYNQEGEYVGVRIQENGLELYLTEEGKIDIIENVDLREDTFFDYFEDIQVNSDIEYHFDLGSSGFGLTEAPGFTIGYHYSDDGTYTDDGLPDSKLYYYDNYMITSFVEKLKENGSVFFHEQK